MSILSLKIYLVNVKEKVYNILKIEGYSKNFLTKELNEIHKLQNLEGDTLCLVKINRLIFRIQNMMKS